MTIDEINSLSLDSQHVFCVVLEQLVDFSSVPKGEASYYFGEGSSLHEKLNLYGNLVKPSLEQFQQQFLLFKQSLLDQENARLAEESRVLNFKSRFEALKDVYGILKEANVSQSNPLMELKRLIDENDLSSLVMYEALSSELEQRSSQSKVNKEAREYLNSTDWYVIRAYEKNIAIPSEVLEARQAARDRIVE